MKGIRYIKSFYKQKPLKLSIMSFEFIFKSRAITLTLKEK